MTIIFLLAEAILNALIILPAIIVVFYGFNLKAIDWKKCGYIFIILMVTLIVINIIGSINQKSAFIGLFTISKTVWQAVLYFLIVSGLQKLFANFMNSKN